MHLTIVAVGKLKTPGTREACDEYAKRLRTRQKLSIVEVRSAGRRASTPGDARTHERERIRRAIPASCRVFCLSREGVQQTSQQWATRLEEWRRDGRDVTIVIGGAFGLDKRLLRDADAVLSVSSLTFPHELVRAILLEQLYRADTILRGEPYHKGRA